VAPHAQSNDRPRTIDTAGSTIEVRPKAINSPRGAGVSADPSTGPRWQDLANLEGRARLLQHHGSTPAGRTQAEHRNQRQSRQQPIAIGHEAQQEDQAHGAKREHGDEAEQVATFLVGPSAAHPKAPRAVLVHQEADWRLQQRGGAAHQRDRDPQFRQGPMKFIARHQEKRRQLGHGEVAERNDPAPIMVPFGA